MIQINNFGWRLGNQMFQIANAAAVAKRSDDEIAFPQWKYADIFEGNFVPDKTYPLKQAKVWKEPGFHYTEVPSGKNFLDGYYQSEKYFLDHEDGIRQMFTIKEDIIDNLLDKHKKIWYREVDIVAVHLRRGDYVTLPDHHPVLDLNYFMKAMKKFPKDAIFLVFSDDTEWCKNNFPGIGEKFFIIEGQTDVEDFAMQTMCTHNVIANSSFSWWAAWLNNNPNKIVVAPTKWFGSAYADWDTKDLYCENWIII